MGVIVANHFGALNANAVSIFTRRNDGKPVQVERAPYIQNTSPTSAVIVWNTAQPASSIVEYRIEAPQTGLSPSLRHRPLPNTS
jgi:hypothetical protein